MKRRHHMPFGPTLARDGRVAFCLWAPGAEQVDLCLGANKEPVRTMASEGNGWHTATTPAPPGTLYSFRIDEDLIVPDPASRYQPHDVHGPSQLWDATNWEWLDTDWRGRPWSEVVLYELHVGAFTPSGSFDALRNRLDALVDLGVTAIELMPVSDFPGTRNWGYDGVLPFAPDSAYGTPNDLKHLIEEAHIRELMVFMDVVYNHFGPEGNYLHRYAPAFFTDRHHTPWGDAINFDGPDSYWVREFFIHNALYWLEEFHIDGLRLDAVHAIVDDSQPDILQELAQRVRQGPGMERHVHLVLENDHNESRYLHRDEHGRPRHYDAQWNDDIHHILHVLATKETNGYYADYRHDPLWYLDRCLGTGFAYQGERSDYRQGQPRGEPTAGIPLTAFVGFLQNHDQVGNRAFGERIGHLAAPQAVAACTAVLLLSPSPPLLFMGQEWFAKEPFLYFCDLGDDLAAQVTAGRRAEFAGFPEFHDPEAIESIPDPLAPETFERSCPDWADRDTARGRQWLEWHQRLLSTRHQDIIPRLPGQSLGTRSEGIDAPLIHEWQMADGSRLCLIANLQAEPVASTPSQQGRLLAATPDQVASGHVTTSLPGWSVIWLLDEAPDERP